MFHCNQSEPAKCINRNMCRWLQLNMRLKHLLFSSKFPIVRSAFNCKLSERAEHNCVGTHRVFYLVTIIKAHGLTV